ncbi:Uncharacterised protein [Citrobacter koseri]|uniref:Uncharacterized protein n=1 Tax=Citrobacter koseri TaxID=545 RepID=A0A447UQL2_CITKO|nr:Uncharacterised protein [Citrobacter koseri]
MNKPLIKLSLLSALLISSQGWCGNTSVDLRFGHNTNSEANDSRIKVMHQADNGFYFSVEAAQTITIRFLAIPIATVPMIKA